MTGPPSQTLLDRIQNYATSYFEVIYKTHIAFWRLPDVPTGGNVLTGAFATALIYLARRQFGQPTDPQSMGKILLFALFVLLLICGILITFDPNRAQGKGVQNWKRLVSVVCVGITLGCAFIFLDAIAPWITPIQQWAAARILSQETQQYMIATAAALLSCAVIFANTLIWVGAKQSILSIRTNIWAIAILVLIALGLNSIVTPPF